MDDVEFSDERKGKSVSGGGQVKLVLAILFVVFSFVVFGFALAHYLQSRDALIKFQQKEAVVSLRQQLIQQNK